MEGDDTSDEEAAQEAPSSPPQAHDSERWMGSEEEEGVNEEDIFKMRNKETGEVFDIRTGLPWGTSPGGPFALTMRNVPCSFEPPQSHFLRTLCTHPARSIRSACWR